MAASTKQMIVSPIYSRILSKFPQNFTFCFAYGSAVKKQLMHKETGNMIDLIYCVDNPLAWHESNMKYNYSHYSGLKYLGHNFVTKVQEKFGAKVYFNTLVSLEGSLIKYGVISTEDLVTDLLEWSDLYLAGRLHKPVEIIRKPASAELQTALQLNLQSAVHAALLILPDTFTEYQFYYAISNLSYAGDFRMTFGENKNKVENIVKPQLVGFRNLYSPFLKTLQDYVHFPMLLEGGEVDVASKECSQDLSALAKLHHLNQLPRWPQKSLTRFWNRGTLRQDTEDVLRAVAYDPDCSEIVQQCISDLVWKSSVRQSLKGIATAGLFKSIKMYQFSDSDSADSDEGIRFKTASTRDKHKGETRARSKSPRRNARRRSPSPRRDRRRERSRDSERRRDRDKGRSSRSRGSETRRRKSSTPSTKPELRKDLKTTPKSETKRKNEDRDRMRTEDKEKRRKTEDAEARRKTEEAEAKKKAEEVEAKRKTEEAEAKKREETEAKRKGEIEARRKEIEAKRKEMEVKRKELEAKRKTESKRKEVAETKKSVEAAETKRSEEKETKSKADDGAVKSRTDVKEANNKVDEKRNAEESEKETVRQEEPSIGPTLPPHLLAPKEAAVAVPLGPALPPPSSDIPPEETIGPQLPPHLLKKSEATDAIGPTLPPHLLHQSADAADSDNEDVYGPLPDGAAFSKAHIALEERALQLKMDALDGPKEDAKSREEWMLELPEVRVAGLGLGPRQFRAKPGPDMSDRSSWTATPDDKKKKKKEPEVDLKREAEEKEQRRRDREQEKMAKKHKKKNKESLLEMHQKKQKKEQKSDGPSERRPFSRDVDLQVNKFDEAQKKAVLKKAQMLDDRFSSGQSKFL